MDDETFMLMLQVHNMAPFRLVKAASPYLRLKDPKQHENRCVVTVGLLLLLISRRKTDPAR